MPMTVEFDPWAVCRLTPPHLHQELRQHGKTAIAWRAAVLLAACLIVLAIDCRTHAENPNRLRPIVTHTAPPLVPNSVMDLADTLGFYRREGLALEIVHSCTAAERRNPPNDLLELTAHSAGFVGYSRLFLLWAAAQWERWASRNVHRHDTKGCPG
jgi:hypothetical protein